MKTTTTSNDNTTTPTPTVTLTSDAESLKIRTSQWALQDIDDREDWQEDFALALLKKQNPKKKGEGIFDIAKSVGKSVAPALIDLASKELKRK